MSETVELEPEVIEDIINGRKVNAIKKLRSLRGLGLKESKELVDLYAAQNNIVAPSSGGSGLGGIIWSMIIIGAICYVIYDNFLSK